MSPAERYWAEEHSARTSRYCRHPHNGVDENNPYLGMGREEFLSRDRSPSPSPRRDPTPRRETPGRETPAAARRDTPRRVDPYYSMRYGPGNMYYGTENPYAGLRGVDPYAGSGNPFSPLYAGGMGAGDGGYGGMSDFGGYSTDFSGFGMGGYGGDFGGYGMGGYGSDFGGFGMGGYGGYGSMYDFGGYSTDFSGHGYGMGRYPYY